MASFKANRDQLLSHYELTFKQKQEELEREKREVQGLRDLLSKSTPKKVDIEVSFLHCLRNKVGCYFRIKLKKFSQTGRRGNSYAK